MTAITFDVSVDGLAAGALHVVQFEGEETLSRPYRFDIDVVASDPALSLESLLAKTATLTVTRGGTTRKIHGVIMDAAESEEAAGGQYAYRLTLVPRIRFLALSKHNRSFGTQTPMSVVDVVQSVLMDPHGIDLTQDDVVLRVLKREAYPARDFWAQYDETDLDFVHRLLEHWGLFYYFEQTDDHERLVLSDATALAPEQIVDATIAFDNRPGHADGRAGVAMSVGRRLRTVTKNVFLSDYNDQTPHVPAKAQAAVTKGQIGAYHEYGAHFVDELEGKMLAQVRAEEIGCTHDVFKLATNSPFLAAGATFHVSGHFRAALNQSYLPTSISHKGRQAFAGAFSGDASSAPTGYENVITAIPDNTAYRSPRLLRRPVMAGVMPATIDAPDGQGDRAVLDPQGRYKVSIGFDTTKNPGYQKSSFVRMAQPYGGPGTGMHFPLLKGTEVMVGWIDGDPDRPLIVGAVPNPRTTSPVSKTNQTQNKIRTASGMALIMNDGVPKAEGAGVGPSGGGSMLSTTPPLGADGGYTAFMVPATQGGLPHYLRLGDIAVSDPYESQIVADPSFQSGTDYRDPVLTSEQYQGVFSYTPNHRTTTTGGNETAVVGGNQRLLIRGNASTTVGSAAKPNVISSNTDYYVGSITYVPSISYSAGESISLSVGVAYSGSVAMSLGVSLGGSFQYSAAPSIGLNTGIGPSYSVSTDGSISGGASDLGESSTSYVTKSFVVGYRSTGKTIMAGIAQSAKTAAKVAVASVAAMEVAQAKIVYESKLDEQIEDKGTTEVEIVNAIASAALGAAAATLVIGKAFDSTNHPLLEANLLQEPTFTVDHDGIKLQCGTSHITVSNGKIAIYADTITLQSSTNIELSTPRGELTMDGNDILLKHDTVYMTADVMIANTLNVREDVKVAGDISAKKVNASQAAAVAS